MHYPWWYVPGLTAPMLIAFIATIHIFSAQYAVGGGIMLAAATSRAHREQDGPMLDYLRRHAWFFILFTVVYGAMTGVGIWWVIGLASPLATEALIHTFVFGWAIEWCTFIIEIVSAFLFYYYWGRITPRTHVILGWSYAWAAWVSLVLITGITAYMLNSGADGANAGFWRCFFNPQFVPQVLARTGGSILLAAIYFYVHASFKLPEESPQRAQIITWAGHWTWPGLILIALGGVGWFFAMPERGRAIIEGAGAMNVLLGLAVSVTGLVVILMVMGPRHRPSLVTKPLAVGMLLLGFMAITSSEFLREAARKPYVVDNVVYGHGIYKAELARFQERGILSEGIWPRAYVTLNHPRLAAALRRGAKGGRRDKTGGLTVDDRLDVGRMLFMYHCNDCHAVRGYSGVYGLIRGWRPDTIHQLVLRLDEYHFFMPPWSGTADEAELLADWLVSIAPDHPEQSRPGAE